MFHGKRRILAMKWMIRTHSHEATYDTFQEEFDEGLTKSNYMQGRKANLSVGIKVKIV